MNEKSTGTDKWLALARPSLDRMDDAAPHTRVLSNGRYWTLLTGAGGGLSQWGSVAATRWAGDRVCDRDGVHVYLRDLDSGEVWSLGTQPMVAGSGRPTARGGNGVATLMRRARGIDARCEVCVAPDADAELRRVVVANSSPGARRIEVTCYAEVVLGDRAADYAHPAFAKLFVETDFVADQEALTARRRPRSANEAPLWMAASLHGHPPCAGELDFETDRCRFLGRGRSVSDPAALEGEGMSRTVGKVLDPVFAMRRRLFLAPSQEASLVFVIAAAADRDAALAAVSARRSVENQRQTFEAAAELERKRQRRCGLGSGEAFFLQDLAGAMVYQHPALRAGAAALSTSSADRGSIGRFGLTGDSLVVVLATGHADEGSAGGRLDSVLRAVRYWGELGLPVSLVVVCDDAGCRSSPKPCPLHTRAAKASISAPARIFVRRGCDLGDNTLAALHVRAQWVVGKSAPDLRSQDADAQVQRKPKLLRSPSRAAAAPAKPLLLDNGFGGFSADGREYVIRVRPGQTSGRPPMPWVNVVSNPRLGFLVSESGAAYTWCGNSRQNKLTPWSNDPVVDGHGEALYLRDDDSGRVWSPQPGPVASGAECEVRHGLGYSVWRQRYEGIDQEVTAFVDVRDPVRYLRVRLRNRGDRARSLSVFSYAHLVLGVQPVDDSRFVITDADEDAGVLFARNPMSEDYAGEVAFAALAVRTGAPSAVAPADASVVVASEASAVVASDASAVAPADASAVVASEASAVVPAGASAIAEQSGAPVPSQPTGTCGLAGWTTDRASFLGRNGCPAAPAAVVSGQPLDRRSGAGLDPCFALQAQVKLAPRTEVSVIFVLGQAGSREEAAAVAARCLEAGADEASLAVVREQWVQLCGAVEVETPSKGLDVLLGGWLLYQTLACRIQARSAFYQSGGALGFRDQLQDSMALVYSRPDLVRAQIMLHAAHQFVEGDVLHWWHPPLARGTRTRFSDDLLWLPYVTAFYASTTGDEAVLDDKVGFVKSRLLMDGEDETYLRAEPSEKSATLYDHCCLAIDRSLTRGVHGLPLMGTGDWNDGMNRVGRLGRGESVWLGFFLTTILDAFVPRCQARGDIDRARNYRAYRASLVTALNDAGWDGAWYRRAYYDDGSPLGSAADDECRIDALAQSWAVLSGVASPERAEAAMDAVEELLVVPEAGIIRLLAPPFDRTTHDPGYIKGYVPGIRENGGQYTHAALWVVRALAQMGRRDSAFELLDMVTPTSHAANAEAAGLYKVEPYVVAADIYGVAPHMGRGGWSWYTGSAAWMYRTALESVLGLTVEAGKSLRLKPCVPDQWPAYSVRYRVPGGKTRYEIEVANPDRNSEAVVSATLDGHALELEDGAVRWPLADDGRVHRVRVVLGAR